MKVLIIILAIVALYYIAYQHGYRTGYDNGCEDEQTNWAIKNMEAARRTMQKRNLIYAGNLIDAETGKETPYGYYHIEEAEK